MCDVNPKRTRTGRKGRVDGWPRSGEGCLRKQMSWGSSLQFPSEIKKRFRFRRSERAAVRRREYQCARWCRPAWGAGGRRAAILAAVSCRGDDEGGGARAR